jgi:hypothetical protein
VVFVGELEPIEEALATWKSDKRIAFGSRRFFSLTLYGGKQQECDEYYSFQHIGF